MVVDGLELGGRDHADLPVEPSLGEPVHVLEGGVLDVVESPPGSVVANHLRLVESVEGFGQGHESSNRTASPTFQTYFSEFTINMGGCPTYPWTLHLLALRITSQWNRPSPRGVM